MDAEYGKSVDGLAYKVLTVIHGECQDLVLWSDRHALSMNVPDNEDVSVLRVIRNEHGPFERFVEINAWPLERGNPDLLRDLDSRIVLSYKTLKSAGVHRPSIVLFGSYFRYIHRMDFGDKCIGRPNVWASAMLVSHRLESTCRVAVRYEHTERFGPHMTVFEDSVFFDYTNLIWMRSLEKRGVIRPRRIQSVSARKTKRYVKRDEGVLETQNKKQKKKKDKKKVDERQSSFFSSIDSGLEKKAKRWKDK